MKNRVLLFFIIYSFFFIVPLHAQSKRNSTFDSYIEQYKDLAVEQMHTYSIPASITMAQALLESSAGNSELAKKSNNHFGIKCGDDWQGPYVTHFDDNRNERFRVYQSVSESYDDHSKFLLRSRYQRLFRLNILDYQGWARGLKSCGYATSPTYADRLIQLIELYKLDDLDEDPNHPKIVIPPLPPQEEVRLDVHVRTSNNGIPCVVAYQGDTWDGLANELRVSKKKLLKYNEATEDVELNSGDFVYLKKKASKGPKSMKGLWHIIKQGESMYSISQLYGIRLKKLYKMNYRDADYIAIEGDLLKVR